MSITLVALFFSLMVSGVTNLISTYFTVAVSSLVSAVFFAACMLRSNSQLYLSILIASLLMCIICLLSSEYNLSPVHSTIDILLCYAAIVGLSAMTEDLGSFCRRMMIFSFAIPVAIVLFQAARNGTIRSWQIRAPGMCANYMAAHVNMVLPLLVAYAAHARGMIRSLLWGVIMCGALAVICVGSRNGIITLLIMIVLFFLFNKKRMAIITCVIMAVILMHMDDIIQHPVIHQMLARVRLVDFEATNTRSTIWSISAQYIQASPWIGVGPGGSEGALCVIGINHAHNNVIQIALEAGIPAALLYVWISVRLLLIPLKGLFSTRRVFIASLPIIAYFLSSLTDNTIHHPETTLLLIACVHEARRVLLAARPGQQQEIKSKTLSPRLTSASPPLKVPAFSRSVQ